MVELLDGQQFKNMIIGAAATLERNKETLDALNVFPVPDGDTGTNMSLTMISAAREVAAADSADMKTVVQALSLGALKGARGNSGVILSQIFAGFADTLSKTDGEVGTSIFASALRNGVDFAYKAVMKPKEGTILTVATKMAEAAELIAEKSDDLYAQLEYVIQEGEKALKETPEQLPVLKEAGVVDAGGAGFLTIVMGLKSVLDGAEVDAEDILGSQGLVVDFSNLETQDNADIQFGYCTEFFIKNLYPEVKERDIDTYRSNLSKIGDCVLVVGDLSLVKTHVHTNEPGLALQYAQILGELSHIKIDNMREQHRELSELSPEMEVAEQQEQREIAVVAVTAGDGIRTIFKDWQIEAFVDGGQSMNPSTEDILQAIAKAPSDHIIVLPNNKNIILAAEQAAELSEKEVIVLKTTSVPQGIAAAVAYDPEANQEANVKRMNRVIKEVKTGLITYAVRDTKLNGNNIKKDDLIGIFENDIVVSGNELEIIFTELLGQMADEDAEMISIYYGADTDEQEAERLQVLCEKEFPDCDVELHYGGQPVYPFMIAVE